MWEPTSLKGPCQDQAAMQQRAPQQTEATATGCLEMPVIPSMVPDRIAVAREEGNLFPTQRVCSRCLKQNMMTCLFLVKTKQLKTQQNVSKWTLQTYSCFPASFPSKLKLTSARCLLCTTGTTEWQAFQIRAVLSSPPVSTLVQVPTSLRCTKQLNIYWWKKSG